MLLISISGKCRHVAGIEHIIPCLPRPAKYIAIEHRVTAVAACNSSVEPDTSTLSKKPRVFTSSDMIITLASFFFRSSRPCDQGPIMKFCVTQLDGPTTLSFAISRDGG